MPVAKPACRRTAFVSAQQIGSISRYVRGDTSTVICFRTQDESLREIQNNMGLTDEQKQYIYKLAPRFEGVIRLPHFEHPILFKMNVDSFPEKDVTVDEIDEHMEPVLEQLYAQIKQGDGYTEERTKKRDLKDLEKEATNQRNGMLILKKIKKSPFLNFNGLRTAMHEEYGMPRDKVRPALDWLEHNDFIITTKCMSSKTRHADFFPLTENAQNSLKIPETERIAPSHFKHTLYCERVKESLAAEGYEVFREYTEGDNSLATIKTKDGRDVKILKRIDVLAIKDGSRRAYEITLSFSNLLANIYKCMEIFRVDKVFIVCERQKPDLARATNKVADKVPEKVLEKIKFVTIGDFL